MALVPCPECGDLVSDMAFVCPHCGCPIKQPQPPASRTSSPVGSFLHIAGLDLPKGTFCSLAYSTELVSMTTPFRSFYLSHDSVMDISILAYRDLLDLYRTISADEQTGQLIKDTLSTTIDISSKKKYIQSHTKFLLITYIGQDHTQRIITFQLNDGNTIAARRLSAQYSAQPEPQDVFL